jgi:hypothetical protein
MAVVTGWLLVCSLGCFDKSTMNMRHYLMPIVTAVGLVLSLAAYAQTPAVTATCNDGSPFAGQTRSGACRGHGGVKSWDTATPATNAPAKATAVAPAAAPSKPATPTQSTRGTPGAGQVWVNTATKVYHCPGDRWYGKTKAGEYMPESQAKSSGFSPDHNKACSS